MAKNVNKIVKNSRPKNNTIKQPAKGTKVTVKRDKAGNIKNIQTDYTRKEMKIRKMQSQAKKSANALELEKVRSNNAAKVAIAGEAGATVTGTVGTGIGYSAVNQQVNGGISEQGGLGRDEANENNSGSNDHANS